MSKASGSESRGGLLGLFSEMLAREGAVEVSTLLLATIAALATAVPIWVFVKKQKRHLPPGPRGIFLLGNALQLPGPAKIEDQFLQWSLEYGLVYTISLPFFGKLIVTADPDLIKKVYVSKNYPKDFTYQWVTPLLGSDSIVLVNGKDWSAKRRAFNPGFAPNFLKSTVTTMVEKLERFVDCIQQDIQAGIPTNMLQRTQTYTSDVIVAVAFGEDWGGSEPHPARDWMTKICDIVNTLVFDLLRGLFDFRLKREMKRYEKLLDAEMMAILERRLKDASTAHSRTDICSLAIEQLKDENGGLTLEDKISITHQMKTFYFAGHDTTATTISWAVWFLSQNDDVLAKIRAELVEHGIWKDLQTPPTYEQLQKCEYLEATLKETLRLYPPAVVSRYVTDPDESYNGYTIGGTIVVHETYVMGRHPLLWKEPERFRPERFLDGSEDRLQEKFAAFTRGPRVCIGKYFAYLEAKLAVSALVTQFDLECVNPQETMKSQLTMIPADGAKVKFRARN